MYNMEDDVYFVMFSVWRIFIFVLMNKMKKNDVYDILVIVNVLMRMFGISYIKYIQVGDDFVCGVFGGE